MANFDAGDHYRPILDAVERLQKAGKLATLIALSDELDVPSWSLKPAIVVLKLAGLVDFDFGRGNHAVRLTKAGGSDGG